MIKDVKELSKRPEVNLTGPDGNSFILLKMAKDWAKQLGKDWKSIQTRMTGGNYENLVNVLEDEFGMYVTFYR